MRLFLLSIFFSSGLIASAFSQMKFQKSYGGSENEKYNSICSTNDEGYIIAGKHSNVPYSDSNIIITRLTKYGNIIWSKKYYYNNYENCVGLCEVNKNEFVIAGTLKNLGTGRDFYAMCIDTNGTIKWAKSYGDVTDEDCYNIVKIRNGFLLVGTQGIPSTDYTGIPRIKTAYIVKINNSGTLIYKKTYTGQGYVFNGVSLMSSHDHTIGGSPLEIDVRYTAATEDNNGDYIFAGCSIFAGDTLGQSQYYFFFKTDSLGLNKWAKYYHAGCNNYQGFNPIYSIIPFNNSYVFCGANKIDFDIPLYSLMGIVSGGYGQAFLIKMDYNGNFIWRRQSPNNGTVIKKIVKTADGGLLCAGHYYNQGAYVIKADSTGNVLWKRIYGNGSGRESFSDFTINKNTFVFAGSDKLNENNGFLVMTDTLGNSAGCNETNVIDDLTINSNYTPINYSNVVSDFGIEKNVTFHVNNYGLSIHTYCSFIPPTPPVITPSQRNITIFKNCSNKICFSITDINLPNDSVKPLMILPGHGPKKGTVSFYSDSCLTYQPNINFTGKDSLLVYVSDTGGLYDTAVLRINVIPYSSINLGNDTTLCNYSTLVLNAGKGFDTYLWQDGSTMQTHKVEVPGTYWVKVTSGLCSVRDTITVGYNYFNEVSLGKDTTLCEGASLVLNVQDEYTSYKWQDGTTDSTYQVHSKGSYWVTVTSGICSNTDSIFINYDTIPDVNLGKDTILCNDASITLNAGTSYSNYLWQDGSIQTTYKVTAADTFWVRIKAGVCFASDTINVTYNYITPVYLGNDTTLCEGDNLTLNAHKGYEVYQWQDGSTDSVLHVSVNGLYWVKATAGVCNIKDSIRVLYDTIPEINLGKDTILCNNSTITLEPGDGFDKYLWQDGSILQTYKVTGAEICWVKITAGACYASDTIKVAYNFINPLYLGKDTTLCEGKSIILNAHKGYASYQWQDSSADSILLVSSNGLYWVRTTAGACIADDTIKIIFDTIPHIDLGKDTILCNSASLTISPGNTFDGYYWQDHSTKATYNVTSADTFWVRINAGACITSDTIIVTYSFIKPVHLGNDTVLCEGNSITLNAHKGYTSYQWQDGSTDTFLIVNSQGSYWVKTIAGVCSGKDTIFIKYDTIPDIELGKDTILCNSNTITLNPGSGFDSYQWQDGTRNKTYLVTKADTFWVKIKAGACSASDTIKIIYDNIIPVSLGSDTTLCEGSLLEINAGSGYNSYLWQNGDIDSTLIIDTIGVYWIRTSKGICFTTDTIRVDYDSIPYINLGKDSILCYNDTITLTPGTGFDYYLWQDGTTNANFHATQKGLYWTEVVSGACFARDTINIIDSTLKINIGNDTSLCSDLTITLSPGNGFDKYVWQDGSVLPEYSVNNTGTYWVSAVKDCYAGNDTVNVSYYPEVPSPTLKYVQDSLITLQGYVYKWYYSSSLITAANDYIYFPEIEGEYKVEISDLNGCTNTDSIRISVNKCDSIDIYPNPCDRYVCLNSHFLKIKKVTFYNPVGQSIRLYNAINDNQFCISIDNTLTSGLYFLNIELDFCTVRKTIFIAKFNK